jgi:hypothetical protein
MCRSNKKKFKKVELWAYIVDYYGVVWVGE